MTALQFIMLSLRTVWDSSAEESSCTLVSDFDEVFDKNICHNSCNNTSRIDSIEDADNADTRVAIFPDNQTFGFLPSDSLQLYTSDPVYYETIPDIISTHLMVRNSGLPNCLKCRIPVSSKLKIHRWRFHLADYWNQQLPDLLENGFPLDFNREFQLVSTFVNHTSALQNPEHVNNYLTEELHHKVILGPFQKPPFPIHIFPLMTRDKQDSAQKGLS